MTLFIHLTDLHISAPGDQDPTDGWTSRDALRQVVALINEMDPLPDFVLASGDLTDNGDAPSYEVFRDLVAPLKPPLLVAMGNHDLREGFRKGLGLQGVDEPYCHDAVHGGLHIITLDSMVPQMVSGALCDPQFEFLAEALKRQSDLPKLLMIHHPPRIDPEQLPWATIDSTSTDRLADVLRGHKIAGIVSGHVHLNQVHHWNGIPVIINSGLDYTVDVLERKDLRKLADRSLALCTYRPSGLSVSFAALSAEPQVLGTIERARLMSFS